MRAAVLVVPGSLETRTGGYLYDRRMAEGLRARGWAIEVRELNEESAHESPAALERAARVFGAIPDGAVTLVDGLALATASEIVTAEASRLRIVALVHLPRSADISLDPADAGRVEPAERRALAAAALVIVTGEAALPMLARYDLPRRRVVVVEPGTDRCPLSPGSGGPSLQLLSVGTLNPIKGHEVLLDALVKVPARSWRLTCAGSLTRHPATVRRVQQRIRDLGLEDRVVLAGELSGPALERCYQQSDLFVLATRQETYGMAVAEALAHGLPVISTLTGAVPAIAGDRAGLFVPPGDVPALAAALSRVLGDAALRARLAEGARQAREQLPTWEQAAEKMAHALESVHRE